MAAAIRRTRALSIGSILSWNRTITAASPTAAIAKSSFTDDDSPKMFHYVRKDKIAESAVMGTHVVALCGEVFPVTKSPKPGSPVCPECKRIFESLPPGGED